MSYNQLAAKGKRLAPTPQPPNGLAPVALPTPTRHPVLTNQQLAEPNRRAAKGRRLAPTPQPPNGLAPVALPTPTRHPTHIEP